VIATLFAPDFMQRLAGSLLHFFWQGALIAMLTAVALQLLARRSAQSRYVACVVGLVLMAAAPLGTFLFYQNTGRTAERALTILSSATAEAGRAASTVSIEFWAQWIVLAWFVGVGACLTRLALAWRFSRSLVRLGTESASASVQQMFDGIVEQLNIRKRTQLLMSVHIPMPAVIGWLRPAVLLPICAVTNLSEEQLRAVLAHELAHIRRHDFLINTLQRFVESILFYHPAVWWLSARTRRERENCCDDLAIQTCGDVLSYAEALIALERARPLSQPALALSATGSPLTQRIRRLLGHDTSNLDWQSAAVAFVFVLACLATGIWQSSPLIAAPPKAVVEVVAEPATPASALAAILTARPGVSPQANSSTTAGVVEGTVITTGTGRPVRNVKLSLSGGPADPEALQRFLAFFKARGIEVAPPANGIADNAFIQSLRDVAATRGISLANPEFQNAFAAFDNANRARFTAVTDGEGRFKIANVAPADYSIVVQREDFYRVSAPKNVQVTPGKTAEAQIVMTPGSTISGRVSNAKGRAVSYVLVEAIRIAYQNGYPVQQQFGGAATDDRGEFRIFGLPPGEYFVSAGRPPMPFASAAQMARTFYPGTRDLLNAIPVSLRGGEERAGVNLTLTDAVSFKISGEIFSTAVPPTAPTPGIAPAIGPTTASLTLLPSDPSTPEGLQRNFGNVNLTPNADGRLSARFEIDGVLPGIYDVGTWVRESNPDGGSGLAATRQRVEVRDRNIEGITLRLAPSVRVNGVVTIDGRPPSQPSVRVALQPEGSTATAGAYQGIASRPALASTQDGSFMVPAVMAGRFRVQVTQSISTDLYVSDVQQAGRSIFDSGFDVGAEAPTPMQISLKSDGGTLDGTVQDSTGKAMANATVVIVPAADRRQNRGLYRVATSDANGRFTIKGIAPQSYKVFAWEANPQGAFFNARFIASIEERGRSVTITASSTTSTQITAIPAPVQ
jgi:beta-lactamase regulating signal transducer with metallopeptidase domain